MKDKLKIKKNIIVDKILINSFFNNKKKSIKSKSFFIHLYNNYCISKYFKLTNQKDR